MDKIWDKTPSKSECVGNEKTNEWPRSIDTVEREKNIAR